MRKAVVATVGEVANYCYKIPAEQGGGGEVLLQFVNACTTVRANRPPHCATATAMLSHAVQY